MGFNTRLLTSFAKLVEFQKSITVRASLNVFFFYSSAWRYVYGYSQRKRTLNETVAFTKSEYINIWVVSIELFLYKRLFLLFFFKNSKKIS